MTLIEERLRAMLRGRLPEAEREELEAWYLESAVSDEPAVIEQLERIEHEVLAAWSAGELVAREATSVAQWQAAHRCRLLATRVALRHRTQLASETSTNSSAWVM